MRIWWLTQQECEAIGDQAPADLPQYIRDEYRSRLGRNGRGRLWCAAEIEEEAGGEVRVSPWPDTILGRLLGELAGGIVVRDADAELLRQLPGTLTDMQLNRV